MIAETKDLSGPEKKQIVTDAVIDSLSVIEVIPGLGTKVPIALIKPLIGPMIDLTVRTMNLTKKLPSGGEVKVEVKE